MISQAMTTSFKKEIMEGVHDFTAHTFKMALFTNEATLNASTTAYSTANEASGSGYTAGGRDLTVVGGTVSTDGTTAFVDFEDVTWVFISITARGALIYNASVVGNPSVAVLDFGSDKTSTDGIFTVEFPPADASSAIVRIA